MKHIVALCVLFATVDALYRNVVYFHEWSPLTNNFTVMDMDASRITHINYAFAYPNDNGTLWFEYPDTAFKRVYGQDLGPTAVQGNFGQLNEFKRRNRHVRVLLSLGGWGYNDIFVKIAANSTLRGIFVKNTVTLITNLGLDGIDIDWEFPTSSTVNDFYSLLQDFRTAFNQLPFTAEITIAAGSSNDWGSTQVKKVCEIVDSVNVMSYDFSGPFWSKVTSHLANLYTDAKAPNGIKISVNSTIQFYVQQGCPSSKVVMGLPIYGASFENTNGLYESFSKPTQGSHKPDGYWDYKSLPFPGMREQVDTTIQATYFYDSTKKMFVTYDSPATVQAKAKYLKDNSLGGAMFWEISADAPSGSNRSLITTLYNALGAENMNTALNNIKYPTSIYSNIRAEESSNSSTNQSNVHPMSPSNTPNSATNLKSSLTTAFFITIAFLL
ncbi:class V chitinase ChiB1 [Thraustotheca clavata]|uniref:Class V chitinase ChiB1 n=1 Tax=Thraustotheca clavata TaxID=74557 RepID=A0A0A7CM94_9STRA|nr:secreted protein [Thraustotheca clavata]OQS00262.1 class V chitinase ChiB1 [Thraustotheca clavata]